MHRGKPVAIALDSEFLKTHGHVLARAVAFVPFSSREKLGSEAQTCRSAMGVNDSPHTVRPTTPRLSTVFGTPIVLSLQPAEVMRRADVLPCGHLLAVLLRTTLVTGERLKAIQQRHMQFNSESPLEESNENMKKMEKTSSMGNNNSAVLHAEFNSLCPHSIPNIRRADMDWLRAIYSTSVHSTDFREASMHLNHLRAYGRGRRQERSISFLLRYYPKLLQEVLHESFSSVDAWCAWLTKCCDLVEKELNRLAEEYRRMSSSSLSSSSSPSIVMESDADLNNNNNNNTISGSEGCVQYKECGNVEEFSYELNRAWCSLQHQGVSNKNRSGASSNGGLKFFAYGDMDAKAIQHSLQFSCCMKMRYSPRVSKSIELTAHHPSQLSETNGVEGTKKNKPISLLPHHSGKLLDSPFEARVVDVTRHTLFAASGFRTSPKVIPRLNDALEKAANVDEAAVRLLAQSDHHNPVWDAKALACITVASGIGLG